jgi:type IV pilus assembly protein PilP
MRRIFIMIYKLKIFLRVFISGLIILTFACDDKSQDNSSTSQVAAKKILYPIDKNRQKKDGVSLPQKKIKAGAKIKKTDQLPKPKKFSKKRVEKRESGHYNAKGKLDPFKPLIQEKSQVSKPVVENISKKPKRILTPLEKIELSQIRLVAILIMKDRRIAMVEEASGKGYEVGIGTYMGKNQGKVFEISKSSIVVKELVKDYKGRLKERVQKIKLHKMDDEG